jgi:branched-chain amino acid transport system permease protein
MVQNIMQNKLTPKNINNGLRDKLTSKSITLLLLICFFPLFTYGMDYIYFLLSSQNIYLPIPSGDTMLRTVIDVCLYILLAVGLNIVCGFTGQLDLGYVAFYLVGGYTAGILMTRLGISFWVALPVAVLNGALWGLIRGVPTLRLTGDYFAIVTFGFAELLFRVVKVEAWLSGPRSVDGMVNDIPAPNLFGIELNQLWHYYFQIFILLAVVVFVTHRLLHSRVGRAWVAIREDEQAAESMGINVSRYKLLAFAISAAIGALGGAFLGPFRGGISAGTFEFWESILIICMVVLGGMGSIRGAIIGGAVLASLGEILRWVLPDQIGDARYLIFGIILILLMRFRPDGLILKKA